jgi:hypothetical protein
MRDRTPISLQAGCGGSIFETVGKTIRQVSWRYCMANCTIWCYVLYETQMKAELLFHQRIDYDDGGIVEMVLWRVPLPVPPSKHYLKYSLIYGRPGVRDIGYDNERGKGDHRHFKGQETPYQFSSVEQLMADFWADVRTVRGNP